MCGILGYSLNKRKNNINIDNILSVLHHRGPDHSSYRFFQNGNVFLGHTRLSILDLSESGHQPMVSECGKFAITFNGEIYNYQEIKSDLLRLGHRFKSNSDTEVILYAFKEWGEKCVDRFNGMFAFIIFDNSKENSSASFFMARDRAGKKPIYYFHEKKEFVFASELKGVKSILQYSFNISYRALNYYLSLGYVPDDLCIAEGVSKLPPAHAGRFNIESGELDIWRYWNPPLPANTHIQSKEILLQELEELFRDSIKLRLISDVPVGVLLSGGVDSSIVAAVAAQESSKRIKTFNISFPGKNKYDESKYARLIAEHFNTEHYELAATKSSLLSLLEDIKPFIDEPIADSSILPTFLVSHLTSQHVKTALGGDGGDELFGGYKHYRQALLFNNYFKNVPNNILDQVSRIACQFPVGLKGRNIIASLKEGPWGMRVWGTPYFDHVSRKKLLNNDILEIIKETLIEPELWLKGIREKTGNGVDGLMRQDFHSYLQDDILAKVDRASMMNSLEIRAPWLDYRLVEWAFAKVPENYKVTLEHRRKIQKEFGKKILPKDFDLDRKQGFSLPLEEYVGKLDWDNDITPVLDPLYEIINEDFCRKIWVGQKKGRTNTSRLFCLIMLAYSIVNI